jgi:hypothetical protein
MKLRATNPAQGDVFGESVSINGDTAVVGAPQNQAPFPTRPGFATVFERNHLGPGAWGEVARLTASDGQLRDGLGFSASISKDTIFVGALGPVRSATYVFARNLGAWREVAKLPVAGWAVSVSGDLAIIGNPGGGGAPGTQSRGIAHIFAHETSTDVWREVARLSPGPGGTQPNFGDSVSIDGDTAVVGAWADDEKGGANSFSGSAYVFRRDRGGPNVWGQLFKLTASDGVGGDQFGRSVSNAGTTAIIGAPTFGGGPGSAYICQLDEVNSTTGACRRAIPIVNELVTMSDLTTVCCAADEFRINATFTNTSAIPIQAPFFEVILLADGTVLQNADGGPGGVGATLTPDVGDGTFSPGESVTVTFVVRFQTRPFWIHVNLRGEAAP